MIDWIRFMLLASCLSSSHGGFSCWIGCSTFPVAESSWPSDLRVFSRLSSTLFTWNSYWVAILTYQKYGGITPPAEFYTTNRMSMPNRIWGRFFRQPVNAFFFVTRFFVVAFRVVIVHFLHFCFSIKNNCTMYWLYGKIGYNLVVARASVCYTISACVLLPQSHWLRATQKDAFFFIVRHYG